METRKVAKLGKPKKKKLYFLRQHVSIDDLQFPLPLLWVVRNVGISIILIL